MACNKCVTYIGDSTTHFDEISVLFEIISINTLGMIKTGNAKCRACGQEMEYDYDETLIPKLRLIQTQ